jgi:hypothetical protein
MATRDDPRGEAASVVELRTVDRSDCGETWNARQRQEGNGRGDAVRLLTRGILRGV